VRCTNNILQEDKKIIQLGNELVEGVGATVTPYCRKLLPVCEELGRTVLGMAGQVNITITEHKPLDPKLLAAALLSRTLGNFRGAVRLIEQGLLVEARVLARCCF
jgi:hypothetical protein